jgi:glycosyltransferase involved in cell wall biosynthesis
MLRILMHSCNGAVSTGVFNREFYIRYGMNPRHISPGVCPADTEMFENAYNESRKASRSVDRQLRIGFAGKLIPQKGVEELLRASALLTCDYDWSVTVVGDGPLMVELNTIASHLGIDDRVIFHGFANTTEMPKLLASFDVVVVPSRRDMRVLVTIEAMAAGAALIVSDTTAVWGPGDLVEDGVTGLIYRSGDPKDLSRQLSRLIEDPGLLDTLRRNGRERAADFGAGAYARTMAAAVHASVARHDAEGQVWASTTTGP